MSERLEDLEWTVEEREDEDGPIVLVASYGTDGLGDELTAHDLSTARRACAALNYVRGMTTEEIEVATQAKFAVKSKSRELGDWSFKRHREEVESRS